MKEKRENIESKMFQSIVYIYTFFDNMIYIYIYIFFFLWKALIINTYL
jgi:hypothetical protein